MKTNVCDKICGRQLQNGRPTMKLYGLRAFAATPTLIEVCDNILNLAGCDASNVELDSECYMVFWG